MPKQLYKITQFHGGLNSNSDARDIAENELSEATDVMVDELGKIRLMGGTVAHDAGAAVTAVINPGYGLFYFSHDRLQGNDAGASVAETGADYLVLADTDTDTQFFIYESSAGETAWGGSPTAVIDLYTGGTGTTGVKPVFYAVDGVLRVSDGNFGANNANKWYGYIDRTHFSGLTPGGSADAYNGWFSKDQEIKAPTTGLASYDGEGISGLTTAGDATTLTDSSAFTNFTAAQIDGKGYLAFNYTTNTKAVVEERDDTNSLGTASTDDWYPSAGRVWDIYPAAGTGFNIDISIAGSGGTWIAGNYEIGTTFIYDGNQESLPFVNGGNFTVTSSQYPTINIFVTSPFDPRITGGRVYHRIKDSVDDWKLLADIDLYNGVRGSGQGSWRSWSLPQAGASADAVSILMLGGTTKSVIQDTVRTYDLLNGYSQDTHTLTAKYKTAVIANRIAYIGNVETKNKDNEDQVMGDAIIKSPVNKFDIFPLNRILETSIRDGDSIVKLEAYADRILIFKKNKMELLNISQEIEFLEDTFMHKGVSHPAATCKTDFGIAWVNSQGCYLYDGQKVNNLLEKGGRQIIKESTWFTFTTHTDGRLPMIGYIPKKRQLIISDDVSTNGDGSAYLYDLVTQSWVKGAAATFDRQKKTNFITDWNGDLVYAHTAGTVVKWDDTGDDSTAFVIQTKDIDFGQPGQKKKIYKVYVTYTGVSSLSVNVDYQINGDNGWNGFASGEPLTASSGQNEATLTLSSPVECYSFQLRFSGTGKTAFEINDATIVFRLKGQR